MRLDLSSRTVNHQLHGVYRLLLHSMQAVARARCPNDAAHTLGGES